jgi:hypothetical protein
VEAWECHQARKSGKIVINGRTFEGKIGATALHSMFLAGRLDDESRCEVGIVIFPDGKTLDGQAAQGLYEITLREKFARLNELTGSLTLTSGVQAAAETGASWTALREQWCGSMTPWPARKPSFGCTGV